MRPRPTTTNWSRLHDFRVTTPMPATTPRRLGPPRLVRRVSVAPRPVLPVGPARVLWTNRIAA